MTQRHVTPGMDPRRRENYNRRRAAERALDWIKPAATPRRGTPDRT
ncbi:MULTISPECIES: hypothetical protein [unclassified Microbispora]|nr:MULTISPECIES: hypothetical protein [unclassified Microbispora]